MSEEIRLEGLGLKPGVLDRIVVLAAGRVDGVAAVCGQGLAGFVQKGSSSRSVEIRMSDDAGVDIGIHVEVVYGRPIHQIARDVQDAISEAVRSQVGVPVSSVDVFVDGVAFPG